MSNRYHGKAAIRSLACSLRSIPWYMVKGLFCQLGSLRLAVSLTAVTALLIVASTTGLQAQTDPFGSIDSVIVGSAVNYPGGKFSLPVTIVNDESIGGFSVPLHFDSDYLTFDSASFAGSPADEWSFVGVTHNSAAGTLLLGGVAFDEDPITNGRNELAKLYFTVKSGLTSDVTSSIDTMYIPPAGRLELSAFGSGFAIRPHFRAGTITIMTANRAPEFSPIAAKTVSEGDVLNFAVTAIDPERAPVKLHAVRLSGGARFQDNGNGTGSFTWSVPFVGTGSSIGSPYVMTIAASDGNAVGQIDIPITVVNHNRPPAIVITDNPTAGAGDTLYIPFAATDPDFETVSFSASGLPAGAEIGSTNPGYLRWVSDISDSGDYAFDLTATDESGGQTTQSVDFTLLPTMPVELSLSDEQAFSGEVVTVAVNLLNRVPVTGLNLTIGFDPTVLTLLGVSKSGSRIASWPQFTNSSSTGRVFLNARSSNSTPPANPLEVGSGPVAYLQFQISSNLQFAGMFTSVDFVYVNPLSDDENIAFDASGSEIDRSQTVYTSGGVLVTQYEGLIGDINLNGVAFEIGDVVYFTNYFINPAQYPLTGERLQNSDINQDGVPATLGDLILLLRIVGGYEKAASTGITSTVEYEESVESGGLRYHLTAPAEFAAAHFEFGIPEDAQYLLNCPGFDLRKIRSHREGSRLRVLILDDDGFALTLPAGTLLEIEGCEARLISQDFVSATGAALTPVLRSTAIVPEAFELAQNYPNPFNPETVISYSLAQTGQVRLEIFNILGETVATPVNEIQPAGIYHQTFHGLDEAGRQLPSGVYFYRLTAGAFSETKKMVLLK